MAVDFWMLLISSLLTLLLSLLFFKSPRRSPPLPPSPPFPLPLIGHLHLLTLPACHCLHRLSLSLGPIFSLRFGSRLVVVISSAAAAQLCFSLNDAVLANRPHLLAGGIVAYNFSTLVTAPFGPRWRSLRKTCTSHIFSPPRLSSLSSIRAQAVSDLIRKILKHHPNPDSNRRTVVLRPLLREMMFEIVLGIVAGETEELGHVMEIIDEVLKHAETANPADFVPILRWIDFGGYQNKLRSISATSDRLLQRILDDRRSSKTSKNASRRENLIDDLLELQKSDPFYDDETIKGLALVILTAGTDTTAVSIEWAISLLLNHPSAMAKLKSELDLQIGQSRLATESDLPNLPHLRSIISETLRIYPPTPLLLPHYASQDCYVSGYTIPKGAMVLVNAWAIHRDPEAWEDPLEFRPERFDGGDVEGCKFMPFGVGRRACPGGGLAGLVVGLAVATVVQCFEWERIGEGEVDMSEGEGLTMPKAKSLEANCKSRGVVSSVFGW